MTFVFVHVPKCAGTSLLKSIEASSLSTYIDYDAYAGVAMHRRNAEAQKLDFTVFDLIYGHFPIGRYRGNHKYQYVALVRDPVDRCVSQYLHIKWRWGNGRLPSTHIGNDIANGRMSFLEYLAADANVCRMYRNFLGHWDSSRFALIGQVERYDAFLSAFSGLIGVAFSNDKRERVAVERPELSPTDRQEARKLLADEYSWYNEFVLSAI